MLKSRETCTGTLQHAQFHDPASAARWMLTRQPMLKDRSGEEGKVRRKTMSVDTWCIQLPLKHLNTFYGPKLETIAVAKSAPPLNSSDVSTEEFSVNSFFEESTKEVTLAQLEAPYEEVFPAHATGGITYFSCLNQNAAGRRGWKGCLS